MHKNNTGWRRSCRGITLNFQVSSSLSRIKNNTIYTKEWQNTNKLLGRKGWYGIKTGITPFAGPCMAASF